MSAAIGLMSWVAIKLHDRKRLRPIDPRAARAILIAAAMPTAISLATGALGVWDGSNIIRAILALPPGFAGGVIVAAVATKDLR